MEHLLESASTVAISKALALAQKEITAPKKSQTAKITDSRAYHYADLAAIIDCIKEPFAKHGLSHSEAMLPSEGHILLVTTIRHESGEWVRSYYPIATYQKPQETGSAITYGRRYSLSALAGIAAEDDDDGQAAQNGTAKVQEKAKEPPPKPASVITQEERLAITGLAKSRGYYTPATFADFLASICPTARTAGDLSRSEYQAVTEALQAMPEARKVPA